LKYFQRIWGIMSRECECMQVPDDVERGVSKAGGLKAILGSIPDDEGLDSLASMVAALSDGYRLKILASLSRTDLCPCLLKSVTGLTDSKLSYHLNVLSRAGMIESRRDGNWRIISLTPLGRDSVEKVLSIIR